MEPHGGEESLAPSDLSVYSLFFGRFQAEELHYHLQIFPGLAFLPWIAQKKCGMVGYREFRSLPRRIAGARTCRSKVIKAAA